MTASTHSSEFRSQWRFFLRLGRPSGPASGRADARQVLRVRLRGGGLRVVSDADALRPLCERVLAEHPNAVATYRSGKAGTLGFFVGQVMKATKGSANPQMVSDMLKLLLDRPE